MVLYTGLTRQISRLLPDGVPELSAWGRHSRSYLAGVVRFTGQKQFDAFFDQSVLVSRRYRIAPYGGRSLVVLAEHNPDGADAWREFLTGAVEFVELAAEHSSLLREPHAAELATTLEARLVDAEGARATVSTTGGSGR